MNETGKKVAAVVGIGLASYGLYRLAKGPSGPSTYLRRGPLTFVMKLTQGGVDVGTTPAPGAEITALVHVANASKLGITPVAVPVTIRLTPIWGTTTIAVADQAITVPAAGTSDVSFKFTFPAASEGLTGSVTCKALTPAGVVVATLPLAVTIVSPVTYAASGTLLVSDGAILVPVGLTLEVGKNYLPNWGVTNLSKYQFTGMNAYANLTVLTEVYYKKADGSSFRHDVLYPATLLNFQPGETKYQPLIFPAPYVTPPAEIDGGKAVMQLIVWKPPATGLGDIILGLIQEYPVASIIYNIGLTW